MTKVISVRTVKLIIDHAQKNLAKIIWRVKTKEMTIFVSVSPDLPGRIVTRMVVHVPLAIRAKMVESVRIWAQNTLVLASPDLPDRTVKMTSAHAQWQRQQRKSYVSIREFVIIRVQSLIANVDPDLKGKCVKRMYEDVLRNRAKTMPNA